MYITENMHTISNINHAIGRGKSAIIILYFIIQRKATNDSKLPLFQKNFAMISWLKNTQELIL